MYNDSLMKIISNSREGNKVLIEVEEDYKQFEKALDKALVKAGREIKVPGFRAGKAPKEMVKKAINQEYLDSHAAQELISELYPKILEETKIDPVDFPKVDILEQKKKKPFKFKVEVDVYPEIKLGKYKGLKLEKKKAEVSEDDVMKVLENVRGRMSEGKEKEVALDDEFAKQVSRHGTLAELKAEAQVTMQKEKESESDADLKNKAIAEASKDAELDIPAGMIEREVDVMLDELRSSLAPSKLTLDDYLKGIKKEESALRDELKKSAEIRVKGKLVLKAIAEAESLKVEDKEMEEELKSLAQASGRELKDVDEGTRKYIEEYVLRRKALDFLVEKAKVTEVDAKVEEAPEQPQSAEEKKDEK